MVVYNVLGSYLGTISVAVPTCADDILILANSECELQSIMDIIYHHTQRDLVKINPPACHRLLFFLISVFHQY
jgi:hypothetical protein